MSLRFVYRIYAACAFLGLSLLSSCVEDSAFSPPLPTETNRALHKEVNHLTFPLVYPIEELEQWLNGKFRGDLLHKTIGVDATDSLSFTLSRSNRIRLRVVGEKIQVAFPVRIEALLNTTNFRGRERIRAIEGEALITLLVDARIDEDWSLHSKTELMGVDWVRAPRMRMGLFSLNIRKIMDAFLKQEKQDWVEKLDEIIVERVSLKKAIEGVWRDIQKPIPIRKEKPKLYLQIHPQEVAGHLSISEEQGIVFDMNVQAYTKIITDSVPLSTWIPLGKFKEAKALDNPVFDFTLLAMLEYDYMAAALNDFFYQYSLRWGRFTSTLHNFSVYGSTEGLVIAFDLKGPLPGRVVMVGNPIFDLATGTLSVEDLTYSLEMQGFFQKLLLSQLHSILLEQFRDLLCFDLDPLLGSLPEKINQSLQRSEKSSVFGLYFHQLQVQEVEYALNQEHLQIKIINKASMVLDLREIPVRRRFLPQGKK